jgi:hypothetical protein
MTTDASSLHRQGVQAHQAGRWAEAVERIRAAIAIRDDAPAWHFNLALALHELDRYEETAGATRAALRLAPDFAPAHYMLGLALKDLGRLDDAIAAYRAATARAPDFAEAHYGEAHALLLAGDFARGWEKFEWRRKLVPQRTTYPQPQWRGEDIAGRTLLIHAEQGLGDTIQFSRYVPLAEAAGATVILEVQPSLVRLLSGTARVFGFGERLPAFDLQCPMMSLPIALGPGIPPLPVTSRERSAKIGIAWRGNPQHIDDRRRSMTAEMMARCFEGTGATLVCLQKDRTEMELAAFPNIIDRAFGDFAETAEAISSLDLVVSVDTAVLHLAGTLGVPALALLSFAPDWRWRLGRDDSDWYPSLRLIRQETPGDWQPVIDKVRQEIGERRRP